MPIVGYLEAVALPLLALRAVHAPARATPGCASSPATSVVAQKLILIVIDGLRADTFEQAVTPERTPWLARLAEAGEYRRAISTFPSLTPVCLSSIATGAHPDVHHIPHLVWYSRKEERLVEYGSSFGAIRKAGITQSLRDSLVEMNARHLSRDARTVFETLEDTGLVTASVNFTCYRGRNRYRSTVPGLVSSGGRSEAVLLLLRVPVAGHRGAARLAEPRRRLDRRLRDRRRPLARHA